MNIVIVSEGYLPELSGVTTGLYNRLLHLSKLGHSVRLYAPDYSALKSYYPNFASHLGKIMPNIEVIAFPSKPYHIKNLRDPKPFSFGAIEQSIIDFKPQIIHVECPERLFLGFLTRPGINLAKKYKIPISAMFHTDYLKSIDSYQKKLLYLKIPGVKFLFKQLLKWIYNSYDVTLVSNQNAKKRLENLGIRNVKEDQCIGVDTKLFSPKYFQYPAKFKPPKNKIIINYTGRLALEKRIDLLLKVFAMVRLKTDTCAFVVIGNGEEAGKINNWTKEHPENIFLGAIPINKIHNYYLASDIFVTMCPNETFGLTILEAMAAGLPVVAPDTAETRNLVCHDKTGYLLPLDNIELFADKIVKLATNAYLRRNIKIKTLDKAKRFTWEQATLNMVNVWQKSCALVEG